MSGALTIWTYDWVPGGKSGPRGFVRDLRLRWACEEADLDYDVRSVSFHHRGAEHFARQPFGQVPFLTDGELQMFESGACLLHLARRSEVLMPRDDTGIAEVTEWIFAALNSVEMVAVPWWFLGLSGSEENGLSQWMDSRLGHIEQVLIEREWLAGGRFTAADLIMTDVLRIPKVRAYGDRPATEAYVARVTGRPGFKKAHADQMAHFAAADETRPKS